MSKAAKIQVRIEPVTALYAQIVMRKGMPFELKIPNRTTKAAMHELEQGGGKSFSSFKDMIDDLDNEDTP